MLWAAHIYRPSELMLQKQTKTYRVSFDHMLIRVLYHPVQSDLPLRVDLGLSVSNNESMQQIKRAYSQGLFSFLPWHNDSKPELLGHIGEDTFHHYGHSVLSLERDERFPVIKLRLPQDEVSIIRDRLECTPGVFHGDASNLMEALRWMENHHAEAYARYHRNWIARG